MEVDHFDPRLKKMRVQLYRNLMLATRHCNGAKRDTWPNEEEQALGLRLLNPCDELDYGAHLFEDPETHELVGKTPAGRYHITVCDLNATHLVNERRDRAAIRKQLARSFTYETGPNLIALLESHSRLLDVVEKMIPPIAETERSSPI